VNTIMTIAWAIAGAGAVWGLMLVHASATITRLEAGWRAEVEHWKADAARARAYAAQLATDPPTSTAGYKPEREYVISNVPLLIAAPGRLAEPRRAAVDVTEGI